MKRKLTIFRPLLILSTSKQNFILKNCFQAEVFLLNFYSERILIEERERKTEREVGRIVGRREREQNLLTREFVCELKSKRE